MASVPTAAREKARARARVRSGSPSAWWEAPVYARRVCAPQPLRRRAKPSHPLSVTFESPRGDAAPRPLASARPAARLTSWRRSAPAHALATRPWSTAVPMLRSSLFTVAFLILGCSAVSAAELRVLVFSPPTAFRHDSIPAGIALIQRLGREHGFAVEATENPRRFTPKSLRAFRVVVFLHTNRDLPPARAPSAP